jgi:hypothetical protein
MTLAPGVDPLAALVHALRNLRQHVDRDPLAHARWTIAQEKYLRSKSPRKLLRLGNGGGKSRVALADVAMRARKRHPFRPDLNRRRGPTKQWIVTVSWKQAVPLMHQFREMLGPEELRQQPSWDDARGWGKDSPTLIWPDGSSVGWRTMKQGPLAHAGAELDHVLIDEPCLMEHYRELERRVFRRNGEISHAMTPINAPGDLQWERDMCADGLIEDLNFPMDQDLFRFADGEIRRLWDGTLCDEAWIAEQIKAVPRQYREIVVNGGWDEIVVDGAFSETFSESKHVHDFRLDGTEVLSLGIDHGTKAFTETAVLVAVDERTEYPSVYVLDVYEADRDSPAEKDAKEILAMLGRHRFKGKPIAWSNLKRVTGDITHYGGRGRINRKSNRDLAYELGRELGLKKHEALTPPIWTAKTGAGSSPRGSIYRGVSWLHRALLRSGQVTIHPRCTSLIKALQEYRGGSDDPAGHLVDALRYALDYWIARGQTRTATAGSLSF